MRSPANFASALLLLPPVAAAQCCLGAQDTTVTAKNGMAKVAAVSLTGTGPQHHGPYRFRFTWFDRIDGEFRETGRFEVAYDTKDHFNMTIHVSPAGNGLLVDTEISPDVVFYDRHGLVVRSWPRSSRLLRWWDSADETGHFLKMWDPTPVPSLGGRRSASFSRGGELFLPAAEPVSAKLERRLLAAITPPTEKRTTVASLLEELASADEAARDLAAQHLVDLRGAAVDALEGAAAAGDAARQKAARQVLDAIRAHHWGCTRPWRDVGFLASLLLYPSAKVAVAATARLDAVLSKEVLQGIPDANLQLTADWLETHVDRLAWDEPSGTWVFRPEHR